MKQLIFKGKTDDLLPISGADLLVTDPPFSRFVQDNLRGNLQDQRVIVPRSAGYEHMSAERREFLARHWLKNVRGWIVWFSDWESVGDWRVQIEYAGGVWGRAVPWVRWSKPANNQQSIPSASEAICFARRKGSKCVFNGRGRMHYHVKSLRHQSKESLGYPGQKPVALLVEVLKDVVQADGRNLVVDDHCGTGTTLLAARALGLNALGFDRSAAAVKLAKERLKP